MRGWIVLFIAFACSGCTQMRMLPYLDQALTLQDMSKEKDGQDKAVKAADAAFERMLAAVRSGSISGFKTEDAIVKEYGRPLLSRQVTVDGRPLKRSLYRYAIQSKSPNKIYVYYGPGGEVVNVQSEISS